MGILAIEALFASANSLKIVHGGYVPIIIGAAIMLLMYIWMKGRALLAAKLRRESIELVGLLQSLEKRQPTRVAGAAVFMQTDPVYAPSALMHNLKHNRVLHDILVFITVETTDEPRADPDNRVTVKQPAPGRMAGGSQVWLHGTARRAGGLAGLRAPRAFHRSGPGLLFPRPPRHPHFGQIRAALLAAAHFHHVGKSIGPGYRILPHSPRPGC